MEATVCLFLDDLETVQEWDMFDLLQNADQSLSEMRVWGTVTIVLHRPILLVTYFCSYHGLIITVIIHPLICR
jgi:hypothetical protein